MKENQSGTGKHHQWGDEGGERREEGGRIKGAFFVARTPRRTKRPRIKTAKDKEPAKERLLGKNIYNVKGGGPGRKKDKRKKSPEIKVNPESPGKKKHKKNACPCNCERKAKQGKKLSKGRGCREKNIRAGTFEKVSGEGLSARLYAQENSGKKVKNHFCKKTIQRAGDPRTERAAPESNVVNEARRKKKSTNPRKKIRSGGTGRKKAAKELLTDGARFKGKGEESRHPG